MMFPLIVWTVIIASFTNVLLGVRTTIKGMN